MLVLGFLGISRLLWPADSPQYCDMWETISGLGNIEENPIGFFFFQAAMVVVGVLVIPAALYLHPKLKTQHAVASLLGSLCMALGFVGFLLTGVIPDDTLPIDKFHEITAGVGFGGILLASFFYGFAVSRAVKGGQVTDKRVQYIITAMWWGGLLLTGAAYGVAELVIKPAYDLGWYSCAWAQAGISPILSFALWERVMLAIAVIYLWLMVLLIREE